MNKLFITSALFSVLGIMSAKSENMEDPLFMAKTGQVYSKSSAGFMYKIIDDTKAQIIKHHDGDVEWPVYRFSEEFGIGITDRLNIWGALSYTYNDDTNRKGLSQGRVGFIYRAADASQPLIFDVYGDMHLGGVSKMEARLNFIGNTPSFDYKNFTTGKFGIFAGLRAGKKVDNWTFAAFTEALHSFGNAHNIIYVGNMGTGPISGLRPFLPDDFTIRLGDSTEINTGLKLSYLYDNTWSFNGAFTYKYHSNNHVEDVYLDALTSIPSVLDQINNLKEGFIGSLSDDFKEYILMFSTGYQITEHTQGVLYFEYTLDDGNMKSQNSSDFKSEVGFRLNLKF